MIERDGDKKMPLGSIADDLGPAFKLRDRTAH